MQHELVAFLILFTVAFAIIAAFITINLEPYTSTAKEILFFTITRRGHYRRIFNMVLKNSQKLPLSIEIVDAKGNAARVDGAPTWSLTDNALGALDVTGDGMGAVFTPAGVGSLKIQVHADADLGEGITDLLGELDIEIIGGQAVSIAIKAGEPSDI